jgi:hypothetical protein
MLTMVGQDASYVVHVLPAIVVFGLGLAITVAPLTATVLAAAPANVAGMASAINNAVARAAGLVAVAVLPVVTGLGADGFQDAAALEPAFRVAMLVCAGLLAAGGVLAFLFVRVPPALTEQPSARRHCAVDAPPLCDGCGARSHDPGR